MVVDIIFAYVNLVSPSSLQFYVDQSRVHFYVDESSVATALHKCSHKITDTDGYKVSWFNNGYLALNAAAVLAA